MSSGTGTAEGMIRCYIKEQQRFGGVTGGQGRFLTKIFS